MTTKSKSKLVMFDPVGPVMTFSGARELNSVEAMKGLKARAQIKSERPMWDAYEANTVSLPTGEVYTALQTGKDTLAEFKERGGIVTELDGDAKADFSTIMTEQVMPAMADLVDAEALEAAAAFTSR